MGARIEVFANRSSWLKARTRIGGSDAAAVIGKSHWMSNIELWELKTGRRQSKDMSENELVEYGTKAEEHIRALFALDHPEWEVCYEPNNLWTNPDFPFAHASLDGWLVTPENSTKPPRERGVLEIKTAEIQNAQQAAAWKNRIPDYYYTQMLWNMAVTEADFGILVAQLKYKRDDDMYKITREYRIPMDKNVRDDALYLLMQGRKFWEYVEKDERPALILPEI